MKRVSECHEEDIGIILAFFGFKPRVSLGFKKIPCEKCYDPARFCDFWNEIEHFKAESSAFINIIAIT